MAADSAAGTTNTAAAATAATPAGAAERNKAATRRMFEEGFGQGRLEVIDETVGTGLTGHLHDVPDFREHLKGVVRAFRAAFPDLRADVEALLADGDLVACHVTLRGTHRGTFEPGLLMREADQSHAPPPVPPTGRAVELEQAHFVRFRDGQAVEHWLVQDTLGFMKQLGAFTKSAGPAGRPA